MKRHSVACILLIAALVSGGTAFAQLYGTSNAGEIFLIDVGSGAGMLIGTLTDPCIGVGATEIEYDNDTGRAFAQSPDGSFCGYEFDLETATNIGGAIGNGGAFNGIEVVGGTWYATAIFGPGGPSELRTLDPFAGTSVSIGATGLGPISGLAWDEGTATMYGIAGGPGPADLLTINLTNGLASVVGSTGIQAGSLQFGPDGQLYAGGTGPDAGNLFVIDPGTGAGSLVGATGFSTVTGLTLVGGTDVNVIEIPTLGGFGLVALALLMAAGAIFSLRRQRSHAAD